MVQRQAGGVIKPSSTGDRETHRRYHRGQKRNHVLISEAVRGSGSAKL